MGDAGLQPFRVEDVQGGLEQRHLGVDIPAGGVELGIGAGNGHVGQVLVDGQQLFRLRGQKASQPHAGVHQHVGHGDGGARLRQGVQGHPGLVGADGAHHVQVQQPVQLLRVGGGPEHQNLLLHEARLSQFLGVGDLVDGEVADAVVPQQIGQLHQPGPIAVAEQHGIDGGPRRPLFHGGDVVLDGGFVKDELQHGPNLIFLFFPP